MIVARCRHIKTNGVVCRSPALTNQDFCFFHNRIHKSHPTSSSGSSQNEAKFPRFPIDISALEDAESVQMAISVVVAALAIGELPIDRGRALLYGLQLAANNTRRMNLNPQPGEIARDIEENEDVPVIREIGELNVNTHDPTLSKEEASVVRRAIRSTPAVIRKRAAR